MIPNQFPGKFISIDGPNGSGKSSIIESLKCYLESKGENVYVTKEPTETDLGDFIRNYSEANSGIEIACLVAADRYAHLKNEIIPQLQRGKTVISDRYIMSSLILQRMDNVDTKFIFDINSEIIAPDLQIALTADESIIKKRLAEREKLTRFENNNQTAIEIALLEQAIPLIKEHKISVLCVKNNDNLEKTVIEIAKSILSL